MNFVQVAIPSPLRQTFTYVNDSGTDLIGKRVLVEFGRRKLVGVARALAAKPKLILLDEPAAGLDTAESQILGGHLREFLNHDMSVFLIDHDMGLVLSVCDYIYVLDFGKIIAAGTPAEIRESAAVKAAYLGEQAGEIQAQEGERMRTQQTETGQDND